VPDISLTPNVIASGGANVVAAKQFVATVNARLQPQIPFLARLLRIDLALVDINSTFTQLVNNPALFRFANSSSAAFDPETGIVQPNPNRYVFWDGFHPHDARASDCSSQDLSSRRRPSSGLPGFRLGGVFGR
jgi:phospholipase/lecithinase/hemolysin